MKKTAEAQARKMARLADLAVHRLEDTVTSLNARLMTAAQDAAKQEHVLKEARDVAAFAQEVLAVVSHDLRNPLNSIMLSAQMILMADRRAAPEAQREPGLSPARWRRRGSSTTCSTTARRGSLA